MPMHSLWPGKAQVFLWLKDQIPGLIYVFRPPAVKVMAAVEFGCIKFHTITEIVTS